MAFEIKSKQNLDFKTARYKETFPNIYTKFILLPENLPCKRSPNKITDGKIIISGLRELQ